MEEALQEAGGVMRDVRSWNDMQIIVPDWTGENVT